MAQTQDTRPEVSRAGVSGTVSPSADIVAARNARARVRRVCIDRDPRGKWALYQWQTRAGG